MNSWFDVDRAGLRRVQSEKDKFFIIKELVSNSFDEDISRCEVRIAPVKGGLMRMEVYDDSVEGFRNLRDAYTLFADSYKRGNFEQRGRFNIGEKFALSMFESASITSTKGKVLFKKDGTRTKSSTKLEVGTQFSGLLKMTQTERKSLLRQARSILPPVDVRFVVEDETILRPPVFKTFVQTLPSITEDASGNLVRTRRQTTVELFRTEDACLCELGIPVVETDMGFTVDVGQKVPLNKDRDNVSPGYLRQLQTAVLNATADVLDEEQIKSAWVSEALEDADATALKTVIDGRYGADAVVYDMSDTEANKKAFANDRNVIAGGTFSRGVWVNIKAARQVFDGFARPAGSVAEFASPKFRGGARVLPEAAWSDGMREVAEFAVGLHRDLFDVPLSVVLHDGSGASATYSKGSGLCEIDFFYKVLGKAWFDLASNRRRIVELLIHEFGHHYSGDHLSESYHGGLCRIGAALYCNGEGGN